MQIDLDEDLIWKALEPKIQGLITRRIILFHDALVERGQIPAAPPAEDAVEHPVSSAVSRCTEDCSNQSNPTL